MDCWLHLRKVSATFLFVITGLLVSAQAQADIGTVGPVQTYTPGADQAADDYVEFRENVLYDDTPLPATGFLVDNTFDAPPAPLVPLNDPLKNLTMDTEFIEDNEIIIEQLSHARMYFLSEEAAFSNALGFITDGSFDFTNGQLIFDRMDANGDPPPATEPFRDDYVDLGTFDPGTELDFFLASDGADKPQSQWVTPGPLFWSDPAQNNIDPNFFAIEDTIDKRTHVLTWKFMDAGYIYYVMGWEDQFLKKADYDPEMGMFDAAKIDYTDAIVVLQITAVPEPSTYVVLGFFLTMVAYWGRRRLNSARSLH